MSSALRTQGSWPSHGRIGRSAALHRPAPPRQGAFAGRHGGEQFPDGSLLLPGFRRARVSQRRATGVIASASQPGRGRRACGRTRGGRTSRASVWSRVPRHQCYAVGRGVQLGSVVVRGVRGSGQLLTGQVCPHRGVTSHRISGSAVRPTHAVEPAAGARRCSSRTAVTGNHVEGTTALLDHQRPTGAASMALPAGQRARRVAQGRAFSRGLERSAGAQTYLRRAIRLTRRISIA